MRRVWFIRISSGGSISFAGIKVTRSWHLNHAVVLSRWDYRWPKGCRMTVKLDIEGFVADYCGGVKDRDLLTTHHLNPKELIATVKKLISQGVITKEQYFARNRLVEETEIHEEKQFLKSLYHCPVCSHMDPRPFNRCPACGTEITESQTTDIHQETPSQAPAVNAEGQVQESFVSDADRIRSGSVGPVAPAVVDGEPTPGSFMVEPAGDYPAVASEGAAHGPVSESADWGKLVGMKVKEFSLLPGTLDGLDADGYELTEIIGSSPHAALYKAEPASGYGPLSLRVFDSRFAEGTDLGRLLNKIVKYQGAMVDPNVLKVLGSASVHGDPALVYEYVPMSLETLLQREPDGLPVELLVQVLPQILNSVGYSHMHRGSDGVVRRLPHFSLQLSSFLFDDRKKVVKLVDCGVWKSLVDLRGYRRRLWEEPGVDPSALAPEAFVLRPKSINAFSADIYALGIALYRLATGKTPFFGSNVDEYSFLHLKTFAVPPRVHRYTLPAWLDAMILKCLEKEPTKRWRSATQMELSVGREPSD
jgi:eukaryotic-like serine/threonine-protein kinase